VDGSDEPTQLGRYQIVKRLTSGGMAELLLGRATGMSSFERHVVIKRIHAALARDPRFVQMFLEEARVAASLHHQNIVQVYDVGEQDGEYFFAMEYVHGEDLRRLHAKARDRKEQIPLEVVISIVMAIASGLHHAHEQRGPDLQPLELVHRDVSLGNVLVGYDGSVKLLDFGLAKAALRSAKTRTGTLKGKAAYMSPEQCEGRPLDRRSDVFALGIVLYELATARRLFKAANDFLSMAAIVGGDIPAPSAHRADLPPGFDELVLRALSKTRESRFPSAEAMRGALEELAIDSGLRTSTKLLADYMHLAFGEKPDPWRDDAPAAPPDIEDEGIVAPPPAPDQVVASTNRAATPLAVAQAIADGTEMEFVDEAATTIDPPNDFAFDVPSKSTTAVRRQAIEDTPTATSELELPSTLEPIAADTPAPDDESTTGVGGKRSGAPSGPPDDEARTAVLPKRATAQRAAEVPVVPKRLTASRAAQPPLEDAPTGVAPSKPSLEASLDALDGVDGMYVGPAVASGWKAMLDRHRGLLMFAGAVIVFALLITILLMSHSASDLAPPDATLDAAPTVIMSTPGDGGVPNDGGAKLQPPPQQPPKKPPKKH
jgi:serine/threonine protein kinase